MKGGRGEARVGPAMLLPPHHPTPASHLVLAQGERGLPRHCLGPRQPVQLLHSGALGLLPGGAGEGRRSVSLSLHEWGPPACVARAHVDVEHPADGAVEVLRVARRDARELACRQRKVVGSQGELPPLLLLLLLFLTLRAYPR